MKIAKITNLDNEITYIMISLNDKDIEMLTDNHFCKFEEKKNTNTKYVLYHIKNEKNVINELEVFDYL
jgi:hypothetical protein